MSHEEASAMILDQSGRKFDPILAKIFQSNARQFKAIADEFSDAAPAGPDAAAI
jgi:HD-GYP domain-containing protein (c-di-GMP phosphodiesterase class II)